MSVPAAIAKDIERRRMAAIRRCNDTVLALRGMTDAADPADLEAYSAEALARARHIVSEIEALRSQIPARSPA